MATNLIREDDAKRRWCPFARVSAGEDGMASPVAAASVNRGRNFSETKCLGSGCMAWERGSYSDEGRCSLVQRGAE